MAWLVVVLALAALGVVVGERIVRERGVQVLADRIAEALQADVELHVVGRPLLWHLARRELPHVAVAAADLPVLRGRAQLGHLRVELDRVRLVGPLFGRAEDLNITAEAGRFRLTLAGPELLRMVTLPPYLATFDLIPKGVRLQTLAGVAVDATVALEPDSLVVRPSGSVLRLLPQSTIRLPLPRWPYGAVVEGFLLHVGSVEAWGTMDPGRLQFPAVVPWRAVRP